MITSPPASPMMRSHPVPDAELSDAGSPHGERSPRPRPDERFADELAGRTHDEIKLFVGEGAQDVLSPEDRLRIRQFARQQLAWMLTEPGGKYQQEHLDSARLVLSAVLLAVRKQLMREVDSTREHPPIPARLIFATRGHGEAAPTLSTREVVPHGARTGFSDDTVL